MRDRDDLTAAFDRKFAIRTDRLGVRPVSGSDEETLVLLSMACSPSAGLLPESLIRQQAEFQRIGHAAAFPAAMRRIVEMAGRPVGLLVIDWDREVSRCVEISLLPEVRGNGVGTVLLDAWLSVVDHFSLPATLRVRRDNRAIFLYRRLGFVEHGDPTAALLDMSRVR